MSEYIVTLKQLALLVAKCNGVKLVNADGTPICDSREIAEVVDEPITLKEIVRCRDCKHGHEVTWPVQSQIPSDYLNCSGYLVTTWDYYNDEPQDNPVPPDGFCAWGERVE